VDSDLSSGPISPLSAIHGHDDTAFRHIDKPMRIVPVNRIMTAWRIFNRKEPTFLSPSVD
jgi:hypothetical protein